MKSFRENPDGEENQAATQQTNREVFACQMRATIRRKVCTYCETVMMTDDKYCNYCQTILDIAAPGPTMFVDLDEEGPRE